MLVDVIIFIEELYHRNCQLLGARNNRNYKICEKYSNICEYIVKIAYSTYGLLTLIFPLSSIIIYLTAGDKILVVPISFPSVDIQTTDGFWLMFLLQTVVVGITVCALCSFDSLLLLGIVNMRMLSEIIVGQIDELEQTIVLDPKCIATEIKHRLLNIIWMHRKYNK